MQNISAIIVTYFPDVATTGELLQALKHQVQRIIVVDNGSPEESVKVLKALLSDAGLLISTGYNSGLAKALNTGIAEARNAGADYVILFDQDSVPAPDMVDTLLFAVQQKQQAGIRVAAAGPNYSDVKGQSASPFVKLEGTRLRRIDCGENEIVEVDHLITSGSLVPMDALAIIGDMEDQLFIDYVDTEWCLRAINKGYLLYGAGAARMRHDLGDRNAGFLGRTVIVHSPLRYYYQLRNGIWLLRQSWVSRAWRIMDVRRLVKTYIGRSFFVGRRYENWKMMTVGIWHGLTGKMGRYEGQAP